MIDTNQLLFERAQKSIPGGVNSPVRAFHAVKSSPPFIEKGEGSILTDTNGKEYIDYVGSWGPMILGHAYEPIINAVREKAIDSTSFGAPTEIEVEMAELVKRMVPSLDKVRMVNSGTEACMSAIRLARGYTGKDKIIKFKGNYHGHSDSFLIEAGSGPLTLGEPNSPGITKGTAKDTLIAHFNDLQSVEGLLKKYNGEIASIIVEPVAGNMGCVPPKEDFLEGLRALCDEFGVLLIFDEVMTGFRIAPGGAQERFGIEADLVTYSKIIGGGLPVGAFGGREEIMDEISPVGSVYQAGTLSGNPLAMAAGYALLKELHENPSHYKQLEEKGAYLSKGLKSVLKDTGIPGTINRVGSMLSIFFTNKKVTDFSSAQTTNKDIFKTFFNEMLKNGVYLPPSPFESWFLSNSLSYEDLDYTIEAARHSLEVLRIN
ncbi:glutamate-1-semialdehyde 2,1-aminomutase [Fodinibius sp. Rm-B-1B1-1]